MSEHVCENCNHTELYEPTEAPSGWRWYWLSFVHPDDGHFLGACCVQALWWEDDFKASIGAAITNSHSLGINPGGEVKAWVLDGEKVESEVPEHLRETLLTKWQIENEIGR